MANDDQFLTTGGTGIETGVMAYGNPGFSFDVGVVGLGGQIGVTGGIDDGVRQPIRRASGRASYTQSCSIFGGASSVPGVAGVSMNSVGVFGEGGEFAESLPSGVNCGVLGTSAGTPGVMGVSDKDAGVAGTSSGYVGVFGVMAGKNEPQAASVLHAGVVGVAGKSTDRRPRSAMGRRA